MPETTSEEIVSEEKSKKKSEAWIQGALEKFADYGLAVRRDEKLSLNQHGLNSGKTQNNFVTVVQGLELALERLLVPRILTEGAGKKKDGPITEWSQLQSEGGGLKKSRRIGGLTPLGEALTDYVVIKRAISLLYDQLLEKRPLMPERSVRFGLKQSIKIGGDTPSRRRDMADTAADYLARHAAEFGVVAAGLKDYPGAPGLILERHAEAMAFTPMTDQELADYHQASEMDSRHA